MKTLIEINEITPTKVMFIINKKLKTYTASKSFLILIFCLDILATHGLIMPVVYKDSVIQITMYRGNN